VRLMAVDVTAAADSQKPTPTSPSKPASSGPPSAVVVKSLAEIKRERMERRPPASEQQSAVAEPPLQSWHSSKITLYTPPGGASDLSTLHLLSLCVNVNRLD